MANNAASLLALVAVLIFTVGVSAQILPQLNPSNFDDYVNGEAYYLVNYYLNGCKESLQMSKELFVVMREASPHRSSLKFAEFDCGRYSVFCKRKGITEHPTLMWYSRGWPVEGQKLRAHEQMTGPAIGEFLTVHTGIKILINETLFVHKAHGSEEHSQATATSAPSPQHASEPKDSDANATEEYRVSSHVRTEHPSQRLKRRQYQMGGLKINFQTEDGNLPSNFKFTW